MSSRRCTRPLITPVVLCLAVLLVSGCARASAQPDAPARYGLLPGDRHQALIAKAVGVANRILPVGGPVRFRVASENGSAGAPVYLVRGDALGATEYVFVPRGERCVFVNDDEVASALRLFEGNPAGALPVPAEDALALMLLHEAGHLAAGDAGSYMPPVKLTVDELTDAATDTKSRELRADTFAVDAVRAAATPGQPMERFTAATRLELALTNISWNLASKRLLDEFAANALRERRLFLDRGYSHPNFELRFLVMNYRLHPTDEGRALLAGFVAERQPASAGAAAPSLLGIPRL